MLCFEFPDDGVAQFIARSVIRTANGRGFSLAGSIKVAISSVWSTVAATRWRHL